MITVWVDPALTRFEKRIRYTFDFVFKTLGFQYRLFSESEKVRDQDILFLYLLHEHTVQELRDIAQNRIVFVCPVDLDLFEDKELQPHEFSRNLREIWLVQDIPVYCKKKIDNPVFSRYDKDYFIGIYNFDIIGNIFFQLTDPATRLPMKKDEQNRISDETSPFHSYSNSPWVNGLLWVIDLFIREAHLSFRGYSVKKEFWPKAEPFAASVSHSVDRLQKWDIGSLMTSFGKDVAGLFFLQFGPAFRSFGGKIRYLFTNWEPYWNFDLITKIEKRFGVSSAWFFGTEHDLPEDADYGIYEDDVKDVIQELLAGGNEIGLLASYMSMFEDILTEQRDKLQKPYKLRDIGVRQRYYRFNPNLSPAHHHNMDAVYDSSWALLDRCGSRNGVAFPFRPFCASPGNRYQYDHYELPVLFSDQHLKISYLKTIPLDESVDLLKKMLENLVKSNGLLMSDFSVSSFNDVPHMHKLFIYFLDLVKHHNGYVNTPAGIVDWWKKRDYVEVKEDPEDVILYFPDKLPAFSLEIIGQRNILKVQGVEHKIQDKKLTLFNIPANCTVVVRLHRYLTSKPQENPEPVPEKPWEVPEIPEEE